MHYFRNVLNLYPKVIVALKQLCMNGMVDGGYARCILAS